MPAVKKVLFTSHTANFHKFNRPFMRMLKEQGYEVHYASAGEEKVYDTDKHFDIPFERSPFKFGNIKAYFKLKKIIDREKYDLIHTHTPMGSVVTRLAAREARKRGTRVIYTAHGFHFFKGAPLLNWIIYYPIEKYMARHTDTLITINNEDFERATNEFKTDVKYVPGVGVDPAKFDLKMTKAEKSKLRKSLGLKDSDFVMIYVAEILKRKNQSWLVGILEEYFKGNEDAHLLIVGADSMNQKVHKLVIKLGLERQIHFTGYRKDIAQLMGMSNLAVSSSKQEGLAVNLVEAAISGLPIVVVGNRGHRDVVEGVSFAAMVSAGDGKGFRSAIDFARQNYDKPIDFTSDDRITISNFSTKKVLPLIRGIYDNASNCRTLDISPKPISVSVVIPAYNAERTIERALLSVLGQTKVDQIKEVIVIDDGSTDKTAHIVKTVAKTHLKGDLVKCISVSNAGVSHARNLGITSSKGTWIALLDADDYWAPNKIERQVLAIETNREVRFIGANSQKDVIAHGKKRNNGLREISFIQYMLKSSPSTCSIIFDKELIEEVGSFDVSQRYAEDANLFMRMIYSAKGYYLVDQLLYLDDKATFGASGLSSNLAGMHSGCLKNITDAHKLGYISNPTKAGLIIWEQVKFIRRIFLTKYRIARARNG